ncbi:MAG TPA: SRPBCC domain-containing protein [Streptosporangiaceae bacterium]
MNDSIKHEITVSRAFDAPRELVYRAFVDPDQLCEWYGPDGFYVPCETVQIDARAGGFQRFVMASVEDPDGRYQVEVTFTEVVENELLDGHQEVERIGSARPGERSRLRLEFIGEANATTRLELRQGEFTEETGLEVKARWESSFKNLDSLLRRSL